MIYVARLSCLVPAASGKTRETTLDIRRVLARTKKHTEETLTSDDCLGERLIRQTRFEYPRPRMQRYQLRDAELCDLHDLYR